PVPDRRSSTWPTGRLLTSAALDEPGSAVGERVRTITPRTAVNGSEKPSRWSHRRYELITEEDEGDILSSCAKCTEWSRGMQFESISDFILQSRVVQGTLQISFSRGKNNECASMRNAIICRTCLPFDSCVCSTNAWNERNCTVGRGLIRQRKDDGAMGYSCTCGLFPYASGSATHPPNETLSNYPTWCIRKFESHSWIVGTNVRHERSLHMKRSSFTSIQTGLRRPICYAKDPFKKVAFPSPQAAKDWTGVRIPRTIQLNFAKNALSKIQNKFK
ncbi:unnamed protein product, partial [Nesidiocoris tenuis]